MAVARKMVDRGHVVTDVEGCDAAVRSWWLGEYPDGPEDEGYDLLVMAHHHGWIADADIEAATVGAVGYHPSLLPRHRGRDAVRWTVHMDDPIAGGTVYRLTEGAKEADAGPIVRQGWCHVRPGWSASDLWREELFPMGVRILADLVPSGEWPERIQLKVMRSRLEGAEDQDERLATWEPAFDRPPLSS